MPSSFGTHTTMNTKLIVQATQEFTLSINLDRGRFYLLINQVSVSCMSAFLNEERADMDFSHMILYILLGCKN